MTDDRKNPVLRAAREPSSWAGLAAVMQGISAIVPQYGGIINLVSIAAGAVAVAMKDHGTKIIEQQRRGTSAYDVRASD